MDTIKTEPEDSEADAMDEGDPLGLQPGFDLDIETNVKVELLEEDDGTYQPPQAEASYYDFPGMAGMVQKQEIEGNDSSDNSDLAPLKPRAKRKKRYDSDEDYIDSISSFSKKPIGKGKNKKKELMALCRKYPSEIENKVEIVTLTEEERANEFTATLNELKMTSQHRCEFCALGFNTDKLLGTHNKIHDKESGEIECDICHCYVKSQERFKVHRRRHYTRYQCKECSLQFANKDRALVHVTETHVRRTFDCPYASCGKSYKRPRDLQWHISHHPSHPHQCSICSSIFKSKALLNKHIRRSHPGGAGAVSVPCPHCPQAFPTARAMLRHRDSQHPHTPTIGGISMELILPCPHCELTFLTRRELVHHRTTAHASLSDSRPEFICQLCDRSYTRQSFLNGHIRRMHCPRVKRFECDYCHRLYYSKPEVRSHILWSHMAARGGFGCACGRVFRALGRLRAHALRAHGDPARHPPDKPFQCGVCGNRFETNYLLKRHTQRHFNLSYPCPQCDMKFKDRNYVQIHYKLKHLNMTRAEINAEKTKRKPMTVENCSQLNRTISIEDVKALTGVQELVITDGAAEGAGEREFPCQQCQKVFKTNALLRRHSKVHSGTTYPCSECDMRFKDKRYVQVHYQLRHLNMTRADLKKAKDKSSGNAGEQSGVVEVRVEKKHCCGECGKSFATKSLLKRHEKIHTDVTYPCSECDTVFKNQSYVKIHYKIKHLGMTWDEAKQSNKLEEKMAETDKTDCNKEKNEYNDDQEKVKEEKIENDDEKAKNESEIESDSDDDSASDDDDESVSVDDTSEESEEDNDKNKQGNEKNCSEEEVYVASTSEVGIDHEDKSNLNVVSNCLNGNKLAKDHQNTVPEKIFQVPTFDTFEELISDS